MTLDMRASLVVLVACGPATTTVPPSPPPAGPPVSASAQLEIHGHRGARGRNPENTIEGHLAALPDVTVLETDLLLTKEGAVVLHHDTVLNPDTTRDERGEWLAQPGPAIRTLTLADLARYDVGRLRPGSAYAARFAEQRGRDGVRIPTLADALIAVDRATRGRAKWNVEIKIDAEHPERTAPPAVAVEAVVSVLRERGVIGRAIIQSFDWSVVREVREVEPSIPTSCLSEPKRVTGDVVGLAAEAGCAYWSPSFETLTEAQVRQAHGLGLRVVPWTVNEVEDLRRVIALGVDGVISDYPDRVPRSN